MAKPSNGLGKKEISILGKYAERRILISNIGRRREVYLLCAVCYRRVFCLLSTIENSFCLSSSSLLSDFPCAKEVCFSQKRRHKKTCLLWESGEAEGGCIIYYIFWWKEEVKLCCSWLWVTHPLERRAGDKWRPRIE